MSTLHSLQCHRVHWSGPDCESALCARGAEANVTDAFVLRSRQQYFSATPLRLSDMPIYATSVDTSVAKDACDDLPEWVPDLAKYLVIVRRGGCSLDIKFRHIADRGGRYALVYNNGLAFSYIEPTNGILKAALISADDGAYVSFSPRLCLRVSIGTDGLTIPPRIALTACRPIL